MKYRNDSFHVCSPQAISTLESDNAPPSSPVRETSDDKREEREEREERDHMRTEGESTENIPVNSNQMEESSRYLYVYVYIYYRFFLILQDLLKSSCLWKLVICLSGRLSIYLSFSLSVCLSIHLSIS